MVFLSDLNSLDMKHLEEKKGKPRRTCPSTLRLKKDQAVTACSSAGAYSSKCIEYCARPEDKARSAPM